MNINIDIIIPSTNKREKLISLLHKLENQTLRPNNIILLNTLDEGEVDLCEDLKIDGIGFIEIKIDKKSFDHGATRNLGVEESNADYIIFMTDDCIPYDDFTIQNLYRGIKKEIDIEKSYDTIPSAAYARQIANEDANFTEKCVREFNYNKISIEKNSTTKDLYGIKNIFLSNVCAIYDRKIFDKLGKFDTGLDFNEDTLYADKSIKNGYSIIYDAEAKVYHSHDYTFKEQYDRNKIIGASHKYHKDAFSIYKSENEGIRLLKYVSIKCIKKCKFLSLFRFFIESIYRYLGYKKGKNG